MLKPVPVIDLFAGPGGLGEGFSREESVRFEIAVSIEKDGMAHETLRLRAAHRAVGRDPATTAETWTRWDEILFREPWNIAIDKLRECGDPVIAAACKRAAHEALNFELRQDNRAEARATIGARLAPYMKDGKLPANAVLIGGPPCQAYSIVGRSRNKGLKHYTTESDPRHFLYLEYLHVIAEFRPAVFVMENVKGILTSRVANQQIFPMIMRDLRRPDIASASAGGEPVEYVLLPLNESENLFGDPAPSDYIVKAEKYGVPQARHRVIVLGIRKDIFDLVRTAKRLVRRSAPSVSDVIVGLPQLRPQLSYRGKGLTWLDALNCDLFNEAVKALRRAKVTTSARVAERLVEVRNTLNKRKSELSCGGERLQVGGKITVRKPRKLADWYQDRPTDLLANHESRAHMPSDLVRYLFVAAFGEVTKTSPRLSDFPMCLLPEHANVNPIFVDESIFKDRFRVQVANKCSMTVTSHIAKDGHAFIHPQAKQCRSLTVREAARLQTFPDSYVFLGTRTSQYTQVGNAVPPYLAKQIASIVADVLLRAKLA